MFWIFKNNKEKKEDNSNRKYFCIANDAIFVDEFLNGKRRESTVEKDNQQQFQQEFNDESSWGI